MQLPEYDEKSSAAIHLNRARKYWKKTHLISKFKDGVETPDWHKYTWEQESKTVFDVAKSWKSLGVKHGERIAILAKNRPRWINSCVSAMTCGIVFVPIYPTLTADVIAYVLKDCGARFVVVDTMEQVTKILAHIKEIPALEKIFVMDPIKKSVNKMVGTFEELEDIGRGKDLKPILDHVSEIGPDDLEAIIYTSGTTGRPKGVMLTHGNFLSQRVVLPLFKMNENDIFLNHLPFCHSFGLTADLFGAADVGATLVIATGIGSEQMRHCLTTIRPTVLMSVPRLYEKLFIQVHQILQTRPKFAQDLFHNAMGVGKEVFDLKNEGRPVPLGLAMKFKLAKKILMKVRARAGLDRVRICYAGGGPTSRELCYFFQSLGLDLYQGYGLTETSPVANVNVPGKNKLGTVGPVIEGVEEKIAEDGEILIRGPNVMQGYLNLPDSTKEAIDKDGWFHSGDIGHFDADGYLVITDRKKEIIVTSGGKNIAPLRIESAFNTEPYIERVVVVGDDRKFLSALVSPNFELLYNWARSEGLRWADDAELAALPEVRIMLEERVMEVNKQFARFEQIKKIVVLDHVFSEETGELTPTQKVKRRIVDQVYKEAIDKLYPKD